VKKKNIYLTIWLLLPMTIVSLLMVWIFYSLDQDRLMDDAVPVGAGAGDTGDANAIGELLAGHDPNAISFAIRARREQRLIDPRDWPGGVKISIPTLAFGPSPQAPVLIVVSIQTLKSHRYPLAGNAAGMRSVALTHKQIEDSILYASDTGGGTQSGRMRDDQGRLLAELPVTMQAPDQTLQTSEPMVVEIRMGSVYEDSP